MFLHLKKGNEYRLYRSHDISQKEDFMYPAYRQALDALDGVVKTAKAFRNNQADEEYPLYGYSNNIVAFSGDRGQGKTSTMLSFSGIVSSDFESCEERDKRFSNCVFSVLPPIDPTILEKNQSFLALVLSRMYSYAQREWQRAVNRGWEGNNQVSECNKNELLTLFQKCLSGINATRQTKGNYAQNLSDIEDMSDSAILKKNLYRLTDQLLKFCNSCHDANMFLVIQLDDTDFQVDKGYEILEDIRRYLSIPNVIILMATDTEMLRYVVTQHFLGEFDTSLKNGDTSVGQFTQMGRKYLDKLIPPSHVIYLPHLDEVILQKDKYLSLEYMEESEETGKDIDLLRPPKYTGQSAGKDFSFQALVLRYIYLKTGLVFAESEQRLHSFIPTTLRGLNQLLGLLSAMDDIPSVTEEDLQSEGSFRNALREKADTSEQNLQVFENYFINDWVNGKLTEEKLKAFTELYETSPAHRIPFAIRKLQEIYKNGETSSEKKEEKENKNTAQTNDYLGLREYINQLKQEHHLAMDLYFFTAILTLLAIQFHKSIAYQERLASEREKGEGPLLISCPKAEYFPKKLYVPTDLDTDLKSTIFPVITQEYLDKLKNINYGAQISKYLLSEDLKDQRFNPIDYVVFFLHLDDKGFKNLVNGECPQHVIYAAQQAAIIVSANPQVQEIIIEELQAMGGKISGFGIDAIKEAIRYINTAIRKINEGVPKDLPMIECDLTQLIDQFVQTESPIPSLSKWCSVALVDPIEDEKRKESLTSLLELVQKVDNLLKEKEKTLDTASSITSIAQTIMSNHFNDIKPANPHGLDLDKLKLNVKDKDKDIELEDLPTADVFMKCFNEQFSDLCKHYGTTSDDIYKRLKERK